MPKLPSILILLSAPVSFDVKAKFPVMEEYFSSTPASEPFILSITVCMVSSSPNWSFVPFISMVATFAALSSLSTTLPSLSI